MRKLAASLFSPQSFLLCLLAGVFVVWGLTTHQTQLPITHTLQWHSYVPPDGSVSGFLFELRNESKGISAYIALDKMPTRHDVHLANAWTFTKVAEGEVWNPRACAKMPQYIRGRDIFMLDSRREKDNTISSYLIHFAPTTADVQMTDIHALKWIGMFLFEESGRPLFFGRHGRDLVAYTLEDSTSSLSEKRVKVLEDGDSLSFYRGINRVPVIDIFNERSFTMKRFKYEHGTLAPYAGDVQKTSAQFSDERTEVIRLRDNLQVQYDLNNVYGTSVRYEGSSVLSFKNEARIYAYALGG